MQKLDLGVLFFLGVLALLLHLRGIDFLQPHLADPDAHLVVQAELLRADAPRPERDPNWAKYPHLISRVASFLPLSEPAPEAGLAEHLRRAAAPYLAVRLFVALFAVLLVPATWLLARPFLDENGSLVAAALVTTSLLATSFAQQARPHAAAAALAGVAVGLCLAFRQRPSWLRALAASGSVALALGSLQFGLFLLPSLALAHLLVERETGEASARRFGWVLSVGVVAASLPLFHPYLFGGATGTETQAVAVEEGTVRLGGHVIYLNVFDGRGLGVVARTLASYEPTLAFWGAIGLLFALAGLVRGKRGDESGVSRTADRRGRWRDRWVVLAYWLPFLTIVCLYKRSYERFVLPALPLFACLGAFGLQSLLLGLAREWPARRQQWLLAVGTLVALLPSAAAALKLGQLRSRPDTLEEAARYVVEEIGTEGRVLLHPHLDLPLFRREEGLRRAGLGQAGIAHAWARYQKEHPAVAPEEPRYDLAWLSMEAVAQDPAGFVRNARGDYVLVEVYPDGWTRFAPMRALRESLLQEATLLARFSPDRNPRAFDSRLGYHDQVGHFSEGSARDPNLFLRLFGARSVGPVLELYALP